MTLSEMLHRDADEANRGGGMYYSAEFLYGYARLADGLLAENAKLRERIHELEMEGSDHFYRTAYAEDANRTLETENARLRERITTQKQTIQSYRDESREWREVADHAQADNAKLRELVRNLLRVVPRDVSGVVVGAHGKHPTYYSFADAMCELGIEVDDGRQRDV